MGRAKGEGTIFQKTPDKFIGRLETTTADGRRRWREVSGRSRSEVAAKLDRLKLDLRDGLAADNITVGQWLDHWLTVICVERGLKPKTIYGYTRLLNRWAVPRIGGIQLRRLGPEHLRSVYKAMRAAGLGTSPHTLHVVLSRALKVAEREGRIRRNPAQLIDAPKLTPNPHPVLPEDQAKAVLDAARDDPRLHARLHVALVLGVRQGEALALRWDDIDLDVQTLWVNRSLSVVPGHGHIEQAPKTAASRRAVPLPAASAAALKRWRDQGDGLGLVFPGPSGKTCDPKADWQVWTDALDAAGAPHFTLHGARGTAASLMLDLGVPDRHIADILGHAHVAVTQDHYLHSDHDQRRRALDKLAGRLEAEA
ncbi:MAG: site-specific integrase [Propionibacteriaceae bacterium]|jgi:integrase|nr:site-specific integrase [Propionibacteriaceae bacterium]